MKQKLRASERVKLALEDEILAGTLESGARLDEKSLAERFGVSRTPIREALTALTQTGLVEQWPNKGCTVSSFDPVNVLEWFEVMASLESSCARLAALRLTRDQAAEIRAALLACETAAQSDDPDEYYRQNERFHDAIYAACTNEPLMELTRRQRARLRPYRRVQLQTIGRLNRSLEEHAKLADGILTGDAEVAASRMWEHVMAQAHDYALRRHR